MIVHGGKLLIVSGENIVGVLVYVLYSFFDAESKWGDS